jgi:phosphopantothenoylcysteine decarboxylase/phosphopantothenate--cysteine ligase
MLENKTIVLAVCGSIAAVRSFDIVRQLRANGAKVHVVMSGAAEGIITPAALEWASGNKVITKLTGKIEHVKFFGKKGKADLLLIAPATANTVSKIAMGIDDSAITTFATIAIGSRKPVLIAPAMHEPMYEHPIVQKNLGMLVNEKYVTIIPPAFEDEKAKIAATERIVLEAERALSRKLLEGKKVLIANGATYSEIDPMRIVTNLSSGKTGLEISRQAYINGAEVVMLHGAEHSKFHSNILNELENYNHDIFISPAAIGDFVAERSREKISSAKGLHLKLKPAKKLLPEVREKFPKLKIVAFKAETNKSKKQLIKIGKDFLRKNKFDLVVVNDVAKHPAGSDTSEMFLVSAGKKVVGVKGSKEKIAEKIVEEAAKILT